MILTDGKTLKDTNRAILDFLGYKSVDEFHQKHDCICEFFEEGENLLQKIDTDGVLWIDNLIKNIDHSAKVEMIDSIAHQWKQPLSVLQTNINIIQIQMEMDTLSNNKLQAIIDSSNQQIKHMNETIDEFRSFFRPHNIKESIDIKTLIDSVLLLIKDDLISNSIKVNIKCDDSIKIYCVPNELKHVLINIFNNAKDAFNDNNIKINRAIKTDILKDNNRVTISIKDNAGGIPDNIINHISNENFSTKIAKSGTGIGLYMSKMIIEKIDGSISVNNSKDGACFKIVIP